MWELVGGALMRFIQERGDGAIALIFLLEEAGVPMPLPGDLVLIWAGYRVATGQSALLAVLLAAELPTLLGASLLYWLARRGGRPLLVRYGRFLHLDEAKLARAEAWMGRNAARAIVLGRVVPGLRIATPLAAGVFGVPYRTFLPSLAVGAFAYIGAWTAVGVFFGPGIIAALERPRLTLRLVLSVALLIGLVLAIWQVRRRALPTGRAAIADLPARARLEAAALAGLLASLEMAVAVGALVTACAELDFAGPGGALGRGLALIGFGRSTPHGAAFAPTAATLLLGAGVVWALAYAIWFEPRLRGPDWLRGATFAAVPAAVSLLAVLPLLGAGPAGAGLGVGLLPVAGELVRHLLYGAALGAAYPVLLLARRPMPAPAPLPTALPAG